MTERYLSKYDITNRFERFKCAIVSLEEYDYPNQRYKDC